MASGKLIWLIRHGETEWTQSGQHTGRTEIPLTDLGRQRGLAVGRELAGRSFALVLTSPRERARETCRLAGYGGVAEIEPNLQEYDYGIYEGRTTPDIRKEVPDWSIWSGPVPQGETLEQVAARARAVIQRALATEGDVACFAHGHILRILAACWLELPPDAGRMLGLEPGSISLLGHERHNRVLWLWNRVAPL
ncbi:MAG TPA: histidine phosphatase family protein [Candidatus Binataceae bacterium]|nr:histidine phosphatase family protein [Candidatus Binataceae bacterium]